MGDTEPLPLPPAAGRWSCILCDATGPGGSDGFYEHYAAWHWNSKEGSTSG